LSQEQILPEVRIDPPREWLGEKLDRQAAKDIITIFGIS
jgi:hypothetical protein